MTSRILTEVTDQREILRLLKQLKRGATAKTRKGTTRKIG